MSNLIIDANSVASKAFFVDSKTMGLTENTGFYTFFNLVNKYAKRIKPKNIYFCFDSKTNFRRDIFPLYKKNRKNTSDKKELGKIRQGFINNLELTLKKVGFHTYKVDSYEADDLCGSIANRTTDNYIVSGDKDIWQLADLATIVYNNDYLSPTDIQVKFGLPYHQIIDYKALAGDSGDNYKGVNKIGDKKAKYLLKTYGTLDNIYNNLDSLTSKNQEYLVLGKGDACLSKELATIKRDLDFELFKGFPKNTIGKINAILESRKKVDNDSVPW